MLFSIISATVIIFLIRGRSLGYQEYMFDWDPATWEPSQVCSHEGYNC
jgi:hypothetical protein